MIYNDRIEQTISRTKQYVAFFEERKQHATAKYVHNNGWFFALCGIKKGELDYVFDSTDTKIEIRPVECAPSYQELCNTLCNKALVSSISSYTPLITYELAICDDDPDLGFATFFAYYLVAALRIKSGVDFIIPMVSNCSWSLIPALESDSLEVEMLENHPNAKIFDSTTETNLDDFRWVDNNWLNLVSLACDNPQMEIALESISTFHQQVGLRMPIVSLWAGIEALLNVQSELRFRLAIEIAAFLGQDENEKIEIFNNLKKMYDIRSKAVHGANMDNTVLLQHILDTKEILAKMLIKIIENNTLPTSNDLELLLLK